MLFEDTSKDLRAEDRFRVDIHFSPGVKFRHAVFDEEDGISPTSSFANMPIKCSPDFSNFFIKRLPQSGHPKSDHLGMNNNSVTNGTRKGSLNIVRPPVCDDVIAESEQLRRKSTSVLVTSHHDPVKRELSANSEVLESCDVSPLLKRTELPHPVAVKTESGGILKHTSDETATLIDAHQKPFAIQRPDCSFKPVEWPAGNYSEPSVTSHLQEQADKQVSFTEPPKEIPTQLLFHNASDTTKRQNAFPSGNLFDEIQGAFETNVGKNRKISEISEASRSSGNTIQSEDFLNNTAVLETPNSAEKHLVRKRFSVPNLSSQSDSNICRKRQVSFSSIAENAPPSLYAEPMDITPNTSRPSSAVAIHGSIERLEVLETLEPLRREPIGNNLEWYGEKGTFVRMSLLLRSTSF